jgi:NADPH-dependent 2,4-dienoyl-CoA reductase/sulfur reductase-like enzyme
MRPNLSKGLWKGRPVEKIWRKTAERGTELHLDCKATQIEPAKKLVRDASNEEYTYDKLLLATGGTPNHLPFGEGNIIYFRTFQDYQHLRKLTEQGNRFVVIGGSFIGSEIAAALTIVGQKVTMIFPEDAISEHVFPRDLSRFLNEYYRLNGVDVITGDSVASVQKEGNRIVARTGSGRAVEADGVIAGIGIHPNLDLAKQAGLLIDNGITVNEQLQTSNSDIYAAGDAANFFHSALGKRVRVEHENNAVEMGGTIQKRSGLLSGRWSRARRIIMERLGKSGRCPRLDAGKGSIQGGGSEGQDQKLNKSRDMNHRVPTHFLSGFTSLPLETQLRATSR